MWIRHMLLEKKLPGEGEEVQSTCDRCAKRNVEIGMSESARRNVVFGFFF